MTHKTADLGILGYRHVGPLSRYSREGLLQLGFGRKVLTWGALIKVVLTFGFRYLTSVVAFRGLGHVVGKSKVERGSDDP